MSKTLLEIMSEEYPEDFKKIPCYIEKYIKMAYMHGFITEEMLNKASTSPKIKALIEQLRNETIDQQKVFGGSNE